MISAFLSLPHHTTPHTLPFPLPHTLQNGGSLRQASRNTCAIRFPESGLLKTVIIIILVNRMKRGLRFLFSTRECIHSAVSNVYVHVRKEDAAHCKPFQVPLEARLLPSPGSLSTEACTRRPGAGTRPPAVGRCEPTPERWTPVLLQD